MSGGDDVARIFALAAAAGSAPAAAETASAPPPSAAQVGEGEANNEEAVRVQAMEVSNVWEGTVSTPWAPARTLASWFLILLYQNCSWIK